MEPFDDSMPELFKNNNIYTHLISDHVHYWEDGGATYHYRQVTMGKYPWTGGGYVEMSS